MDSARKERRIGTMPRSGGQEILPATMSVFLLLILLLLVIAVFLAMPLQLE